MYKKPLAINSDPRAEIFELSDSLSVADGIKDFTVKIFKDNTNFSILCRTPATKHVSSMFFAEVLKKSGGHLPPSSTEAFQQFLLTLLKKCL